MLSGYRHTVEVYAAAKSLQLCPTLCNPRDSSPPGSPVPGILQAGTLEWVSFSNAWKWKVKVKSLSRVRLSATSWTAAYQAPLSKGFSRQEYWSGVSLPSQLKYIVTHQNSSLHYDSALSSKRREIILKTGTLLKNTPTCSIFCLSLFLCVSLYCRWIIFSKPIYNGNRKVFYLSQTEDYPKQVNPKGN